MLVLMKKWLGVVLRQVGLDAESLRNMNRGLKWTGLVLVAFITVALAVSLLLESPPKPISNNATSGTVIGKSNTPSAADKSTGLTAKAVFGWVALISIALAGLIEPREPKRDGRFKTGFKKNATVRRKTADEIQTQKWALAVAAVCGALWYFL